MKLGPDVLLAIMAALQKGLLEEVDISDELRKIEVEVDPVYSGLDENCLLRIKQS